MTFKEFWAYIKPMLVRGEIMAWFLAVMIVLLFASIGSCVGKDIVYRINRAKKEAVSEAVETSRRQQVAVPPAPVQEPQPAYIPDNPSASYWEVTVFDGSGKQMIYLPHARRAGDWNDPISWIGTDGKLIRFSGLYTVMAKELEEAE